MPYQQIGDLRLYYEQYGSGEPILFIHGLGSSTVDWQPQVEFFSKYYQVITFDLRGHGQSDKPTTTYRMVDLAHDVVGLVQALDVVPVHVVGLSLGGAIAFQLVVAHPEVVKTVTIVNSGPEVPLKTIKDYKRAVGGFISRQLKVRLFGMEKLGRQLADTLFPESHQTKLHQQLIKRWATNDQRTYLATLSVFRGWCVTDQLSHIDCPVFVITAEHDYTPISWKQAYTAQIPRSRLFVIPRSRHFTPLDQPDAFNAALLSFLKQPYLKIV